MPSRPKLTPLFVIVLLLCTLQNSEAYRVENLEFKDTFKRGSVDLSLRGAGLKKFLSIRVVAAGLYLKSDVPTKDILTVSLPSAWPLKSEKDKRVLDWGQ